MLCGDMVEAHPDHMVEALKQSLLAYLLCITCCASLRGSCGTEGTWRWEGGTPRRRGCRGCRGGLTKRGGQGLLAEDLLVQLLCLLILALLQVG